MEAEDTKPNPARIQEFLDADHGNIISVLNEGEDGESKVGGIGQDVVTEYDQDYNDSDYQRRKKTWAKGQSLVRQEIEQKNTPFEHAANVKYPLMTTAAVQFASRAYPEIVQGNTVVRPKIVGDTTPPAPAQAPQQPQRPQQGQRQGQRPQQPQGQPQAPQQGQPQQPAPDPGPSKIERAENVCRFINWQLFNEIHEWEEDTDKLMGMLPLYGSMFRGVYYSQEKKRICTEILTPEELILPYNTPSIKDSPRISKEFPLYPKQVRERVRSGMYDHAPHFDDEDSEAPETFIEQCKWLDLDGDNFKEPYLVTVHKDSGDCVRISPNYRMEDIIQNEDGEISRIKQLQYYVKYTFIPSTDRSIYDLGFFDLLYPINSVINTVINQLLDSGTRQNTGSGFISAGFLREKGNVSLRNGEFKSVADNGQKIRDQIYQMDWKGPSPTLFQLLGFMVDSGRDIGNLKEVLEGTQQTNQTATTTMALIEQGLKVFSGIYKRIHRTLSDELSLIRFWNHEIRNPLYGEVIDTRFSQDDFADDDLDFVPVSDPAVVTDMQKMGRVQFLLQFLNDPYFDQMKLREQAFEGANIDGFDELKAGQDPEKVKLQQQLQQAQQAIQKLQEAYKTLKDDDDFEKKKDMMKLDTQAALDKEKARNLRADTMKKLAEAEAAEDGPQIEKYKAQMEALNGSGGVRGVDTAPGNRQGQGVLAGVPSGPGRQQGQPNDDVKRRVIQALTQNMGKQGGPR